MGIIKRKTEIFHLESIKEMPKLKLPAKASLWYIMSSAISRTIGAAGTPIFTRLLTPEEYGIFPLYNTWLAVATVILTLELTGGVIYRGLQKFSNSRDRFLSATFGLFLSIFLFICALYFAFSNFINKITGLSTITTSFMIAQIFASAAIGFYTGRARFEYRYKDVAFLNIASAIGAPLLSISLILLTKLKGEARIIGTSLTLMICAIPIIYIILKRSSVLFDKEIWRFLLRFNLPLLPHYLSMSLILRVGEMTVSRVYGTEALGKYSVALSVGMSLTMISGGLLSALSPWMLRKIKSGEMDKIRDFLLTLTKALSLICLLLLTIAPEAIKILTPHAFHDALPAVYPLALCVIPTFLAGAMTSGEMYYEKSGITALPSIIAAAISCALSLLLLPKMDYRFSGIFTLLSYIALAAFGTLIFKRMSGNVPIHVKKSITTLALTIGYALLLFLFRDVLASRILLAIPLLPALLTLGRTIYREIKE